MGYTHYFAYKPDDPTFIDRWPQMTADAQRVIDALPDIIGPGVDDFDGHDGPEADERWIWLNGVGQNAHETLLIHGPGPAAQATVTDLTRWFGDVDYIWAFCKTAHKPYDIVVGAILLRCHRLAPQAFVIDSDGDWDADWQPIRGLYTGLFGATGPNPLNSATTDGPPAATKSKTFLKGGS